MPGFTHLYKRYTSLTKPTKSMYCVCNWWGSPFTVLSQVLLVNTHWISGPVPAVSLLKWHTDDLQGCWDVALSALYQKKISIINKKHTILINVWFWKINTWFFFIVEILWSSVTLGKWKALATHIHTHTKYQVDLFWCFLSNITTGPCGHGAPLGSPDLFWGQTVDFLHLLSYYYSQSAAPQHNWCNEVEMSLSCRRRYNCEHHHRFLNNHYKLLLTKWSAEF